MCHSGASDCLYESLLDDTVLNVEGQLAAALLRSAPADTVCITGNIADLLSAYPLCFFRNRCSAVIAGLMWVAAYPVEGQAPLVYSIIYNGAYLIPELAICMVLAGILGNRLYSIMKSA